MSFEFRWPLFDEPFKRDLAHQIEEAINYGPSSPIIIGRIAISTLEPGTIPPAVEILEIGELNLVSLRVLFRVAYRGDAKITLQLRVKYNPFSIGDDTDGNCIAPVELTVSNLVINAVVSVYANRCSGVTVAFKNDPLESIQINSSFDGISTIKSFIQTELETRVREALRTEVPKAIHELSRQIIHDIFGPIDEVESRLSSIASTVTGPVRVRSPPIDHALWSIPEDEEARHRHRFDTESLASIISRTSIFSTTTSRFPSMVRSRYGTVVGHQLPLSKRLEILRSQNSSLSTVDLPSSTIIHCVAAHTKDRLNRYEDKKL